MSARRTLRVLIGLLAAFAAAYWAGRELGLGNDELLGYLGLSVLMVFAAGIVGLAVFIVLRLFKRK